MSTHDGETSVGPIRVLLAEDQAMVRGALSVLLSAEPDIDVVAECSDGAQAVARAAEGDVDVCVMDVEMPTMNGLDATAEIVAAGGGKVQVLIVTTFGRAGYLRTAMSAGASGFVVKDAPAEQLAEAIRRVRRGLRVIDPALAADSLATGINPLSPREREVMRLAATGATVAEIAASLFLTPGTVRNHISRAIAKTNTANRYQAAKAAQRNGWL
ncbi:response regulator transcription factor [Corynebacterium heidelbergense]|uniref:DNA-binding response regulator n=1 Tax=Corynebacterium heidelbergense TaxID=2055947 RepID=A0A364VAJ9_9CORY|nr:response regulator transcription factor [Corynebacterium heidelbergense]RAV33634.1 DNA-binding response regulator [Corynebacterium heidelbergense]WCZ36843.1 Transcriptional regulatory protein LiaR [Corynebacterium heidelbergense]